jgi:hypothetical protein
LRKIREERRAKRLTYYTALLPASNYLFCVETWNLERFIDVGYSYFRISFSFFMKAPRKEKNKLSLCVVTSNDKSMSATLIAAMDSSDEKEVDVDDLVLKAPAKRKTTA